MDREFVTISVCGNNKEDKIENFRAFGWEVFKTCTAESDITDKIIEITFCRNTKLPYYSVLNKLYLKYIGLQSKADRFNRYTVKAVELICIIITVFLFLTLLTINEVLFLLIMPANAVVLAVVFVGDCCGWFETVYKRCILRKSISVKKRAKRILKSKSGVYQT